MGQVLVDFLSVSSESLAITFVFIDHVQNTNITITTNYLSPDPACPIHNLSLIWLDTGWTWLALWLNGFCLGISMMDSLWTWRTDSINGGDPDGMSLMMYVRLMHGVSGHVSQSWALCSVSCLCMSLNMDINIQRSASWEPRVTWGRLNHCDHAQSPDTGLRRQLVTGKLCQCLDNDNVVSDDPGTCHGPWSVILFEQIFDLGNDTREARESDFINNLLLL